MTTELEKERLNRSLMEHIILGVAHEINNPNSFVRLNAMTLKKMMNLLGPCLDEYGANHPDEKFGPYNMVELRAKLSQTIEGILDASVRIITVADKLKQCSSFALSKASQISVKEVMQNVLSMHHFLLEKWAEVDFQFEESQSYHIQGFALQLEQAFSILLTNACDAISEKYPTSENRDGKIKIVLAEESGKLLLSFQDNGCGMDEETLAKIFDPYFTTKPQGVGDGLGLPLCLAIIDRHGGKLEAKSQKGEGSLFAIVLPKEFSED